MLWKQSAKELYEVASKKKVDQKKYLFTLQKMVKKASNYANSSNKLLKKKVPSFFIYRN